MTRAGSRRLPQHRKWRWWVLGVVPLEVLAVGYAVVLVSRPVQRLPSDLGVVPPVTLVASAAAPSPSHSARTKASKRHSVRRGPPTMLRLGAVGIDARVVPVGVTPQGALDVPDDVDTLGWWSGGSAPGDAKGTVVIDGHVDARAQGRGEFFVLERARPGDVVEVTTARGAVSYVVAARTIYDKSALPADVFDRGGRPRLVLITCGGPFDSRTGHYQDNVVVYALPR